MRLYSWNVNGIRAAAKKEHFFPFLENSRADVVCLQETKAEPGQLPPEILNPAGYLSYWSSSRARRGYSGVAIYSKNDPASVATELPDAKYAQEGRMLVAEYPSFFLVNAYFPNGQKDEDRLGFKMGYYAAFLAHAQKLRKTKPVVVCGDFNTSHREIDLARPKENENVSGFLPEEREWMTKFISEGYVDTFRRAKGDTVGDYTWWSYRAGARANNVGWRLDYFFVSEELAPKIKDAWIEPAVMGSDHCPVGLELDL
ncbi:MAG: exodeoxyribonuclease III [Deltaproteobacteria bacterium]|jgi:exodeoxyribonuclease-3|nr:exodeoxyribonuclease III [Deltaproteobacteria bacterium]